MISDKNRNTVHPDVHAAFRAESFSGTGSNDWYTTGPGERNRTEVRNEFIANESLNEIAQLPEEERQAKLRWILSARFDPTNEAQAALFS